MKPWVLAGATLLVLVGMSGSCRANTDPPPWLLDMETYNGWYYEWTDAGFDSLLRECPLLVGAPLDPHWPAKAHQAGVRLLHYITLYQAPASGAYQDIDMAQHPDWWVIKADGHPQESVFFNSENYNWYEICSNVAEENEAELAFIRRIMDAGFDGLFIDNAHPRGECFGEKLGIHKHQQSDLDNFGAYLRLLDKVVALVKSYGQDKVVILNPGGPNERLVGYGEGQMWESYICTWAADHRWTDWDTILAAARNWAPAIARGHQIFALSYLGSTKYSIRDDALWCYACARLSGFKWADWFTGSKDPVARSLYTLRLGQPIGDLQSVNGVYYREFENGLVVVNPGTERARVLVPLSRPSLLRGLWPKVALDATTGRAAVSIPPQSGRVFVRQ